MEKRYIIMQDNIIAKGGYHLNTGYGYTFDELKKYFDVDFDFDVYYFDDIDYLYNHLLQRDDCFDYWFKEVE